MSNQAQKRKAKHNFVSNGCDKKQTNVNAFIGTVKKLVMKMVKGTLIKV